MHLPKQLLPIKKKNLLQYSIDQALASKGAAVYVVLGARADRVRDAIRTSNIVVVTNEHWLEGMGTSIRAGIAALPGTVDAAIISLCDQPFLTSSLFDNLIDTHVSSGRSIVACEYDGSPGVPALFARKHFEELRFLQGDSGAKKIILDHRQDAAVIQFPKGSVDLDTAEDYQNFIRNTFKISF